MIDLLTNGLPQVLYWLFCTLAVFFAVGVIAFKNPVASAFSLILVLLNVAGMFAFQEAYFIAAVQILVYAGAIMVLFVFVIMLLSIEKIEMDWPVNRLFWIVPLSLSAMFFAMMGWVFSHGDSARVKGPFSVSAVSSSGGNIRVISEIMFSDYSIPFLIMGILLSISVVGAVVLAKRKVE